MTNEHEVPCEAGVYLISQAQRERVLRSNGVVVGVPAMVLSGNDLAGREAFFTAIAGALSFPDYFGHNWDAVNDCLTDPSVIPAEGVVLMLDGFGQMADREPEQWGIALKVLGDACDFWRPLRQTFLVMLYGPAALAPGVQLLPPMCLDARDD